VIGRATTVKWLEDAPACVLGCNLAPEQRRGDCVEELDAVVRAIEAEVPGLGDCHRADAAGSDRHLLRVLKQLGFATQALPQRNVRVADFPLGR
jgi:hypothetical protein